MADTGTIQTKDPNARKNYHWDWSKWLQGGTIAASEFIVDPPGLQIVQQGHTDTSTTVRLSDGTAGVTYKVTNRITTADGEVDDRTMHVQVRAR